MKIYVGINRVNGYAMLATTSQESMQKAMTISVQETVNRITEEPEIEDCSTWKWKCDDDLNILTAPNGQEEAIVRAVTLTIDDDDPIRQFAYAILSGDMSAIDAVKDILKL